MSDSRQGCPPAAVVGLAGWLVPGAGYWLIGQRSRGLTVGVTILTLFILGTLIGGVRVVEAPPGMGEILQRPWFIGQALAGGIGLAAAWASNALSNGSWSAVVSHSRIAEIGTLYTAVAGMLNLMTVVDAVHRRLTTEAR